MSLRRKQIIIFLTIIVLIVSGSIWLFTSRVFCYDTTIAHPGIVQLAVQLYNQQFPGEKLSDEDLACLEQGAREEDTPTRWLNHFYDPTNNAGLWFGTSHLSAKDWAQSPEAQTSYALGDQSWQRALSDYQGGDRKKALIELGHVLHLLADMAVPAHTRNDVHIVGDSYEQFVKNNWEMVSKQITVSQLGLNQNCLSLNQCFDYLANYSNNNFYSDDTVNKGYNEPRIQDTKTEYIKKNDGKKYYFRVNNSGIRLCWDKNISDWQDFFNDQTDNDNCVVGQDDVSINYSQHLLPQAISASASVIKLFFTEAQKEQGTKLPVWRIGLSGLGNAVLGKVVSTAESVYDYLKEKSGMSTTVQAGEVVMSPEQITDSNTEIGQKLNQNLTNISETKIRQKLDENLTEINEPNIEGKTIIDNNEHGSDNYQLPVTNYQLPVTNYQLPVTKPVYYSGGGGGGMVHEADNMIQTNTTPAPDLTGSVGAGQASTTPTTTDNNSQTANNTTSTTSTTSFTTSTTLTDTTPPTAPEYLQSIVQIIYTDIVTTSIQLQVSSDTVKIFIYNNPVDNNIGGPIGEIITNSSTLLNIVIDLNEGDNYLYFTAEDRAGNISAPSGVIHYVLDTEAPATPTIQVSEETTDSPTSTIINLDIIGADNLTSTTYDISYLISPITPTSTWQDFVTNTPNTHLTFKGIRGKTYKFKVRARDAFGHSSDWGTEISYQALYSQGVVINEVAWMGTCANPVCLDDEWLELYNNTDQDIDLSSWQLLVSGKIITWYKNANSNRLAATPIIKAHGYYLLERTDDNAVAEISADGVFTGALNNNGEKLTLVDGNNNIIDEVDCASGWFKGSSSTYSSMERINSQTSGSQASNWQTALGSRPLGRSYLGSPLIGSPRQPNFGFIVLRDTQLADLRILDKVNNPWVLSDYDVPVGKKLQMEAGVVVKGQYPTANLKIHGNLTVNGTDVEPVIMTSGRDQELGNDLLNTIVGTWASSTPAPGDWQGIVFFTSSTAQLDHLIIKYAGHSFKSENLMYAPFVSQAIRMKKAEVQMQGGQIINTLGTAVYTEGGSGIFTQTAFRGGDLAIEAHDTDLHLRDSSFADFTNTQGPIFISGLWPKLTRLVLENNVLNKIYLGVISLVDSLVNISRELSQMAYFNYLTISASSTLQIESGAEINFVQSGGMEVRGELQSLGSADLPIIIKPFLAGKNWGQIYFNQARGQLNYTHFQDGNLLVNATENTRGLIYANSSQLNLQGVYLENYQHSSAALQASNSILQLDNIYVQDQIKTNNSYGLVLRGGTANINDSWFTRLNYGIIADANVNLQVGSTMSSSSFSEVDSFIAWPNWLGFGLVSSTTST